MAATENRLPSPRDAQWRRPTNALGDVLNDARLLGNTSELLTHAETLEGLSTEDLKDKPVSSFMTIKRVALALRELAHQGPELHTLPIFHDHLAEPPVTVVERLPEFVHDYFTMNRERHQFFARNGLVRLTRTEFKILDELADHVGEVISNPDLARMVWENKHVADESKIIKGHMSNLRKKIQNGQEDVDPYKIIETVAGVGYRLIPNARKMDKA